MILRKTSSMGKSEYMIIDFWKQFYETELGIPWSPMNLPDKIYEEWIKETDSLEIKANMSAVQVVGELTRALKRVVVRNGGTSITVDGVKYDKDNKVIE